MSRLIYGIGYNSKGKYKTAENGIRSKSNIVWHNMIKRCYSTKAHKERPTYSDCLVAECWYDYQNFAEWYDGNLYSDMEYELDKDLLVSDNKLYSPETCCLIPRDINLLLTNRSNDRGLCPQGVDFHKPSGRYRASIRINGKKKHLGYFNCPNEAYQAYKTAKEAYVKEKALEWQDRIADNVFQALMSWRLQ